LVNVVCDNGDAIGLPVIGVRQIMSETVDIQTKPKPARDNSKDKRTLDQVEKWMEMIREISREPVKN
jgi:hypothetical protein